MPVDCIGYCILGPRGMGTVLCLFSSWGVWAALDNGLISTLINVCLSRKVEVKNIEQTNYAENIS